ncbi:MAG: hypothetical protein E7665_08255 [Ruminococcaceae bacterium]|nr:hypothetical protein [Oscillospiraceae bacterium]
MNRDIGNKTKKIAYGAVLTALCTIMLGVGSIITTLDISLAAYAGFVILFITIEGGDKMAFSVYFCTSVLAFIILPQKSPAFIFAFFMGWYPIFKKHVEKIKPFFAWIVKLSAYNTAILLIYLVTVKILSLEYELVEMTLLYFLLANVAFIFFDIALNIFIPFYIFKIRKRLGFKKDLF